MHNYMLFLEFFIIFFVALEHLYIMILEMYFSKSNVAKRTFGLDEEFIKHPSFKVLMANQGLYNGFLAAGILWGLFSDIYLPIVIFFISCVLIAAIFGWLSSKKFSIFLKQGIPALLALVMIYINHFMN